METERVHRVGDGQARLLAGRQLHGKAVDVPGRLGRLLPAGEAEVGPVRVFHQHRPVAPRPALELVGLAFHQAAGGVEDALLQLHLGEALPGVLDDGLDLGVEVHRVGDEALVAGGDVEEAGVPGVGGAVEDGDRPLHEAQAGGVLQAQAQQRELGVGGLVVDREAFGLDRLADDRQHG
ncbi:MAG TPA: hypothetical protein VJ739_07520 [Gemmataceae bacterium]|nr:hypothetical protein [Gemmataceae bacterium]